MLPQIFISKGRMGGGRAEREGGREGGREGETETENLLGVNAHNDWSWVRSRDAAQAQERCYYMLSIIFLQCYFFYFFLLVYSVAHFS